MLSRMDFLDTTTYLMKIANFPTPSQLAPLVEVTSFKFLESVKNSDTRVTHRADREDFMMHDRLVLT